MAIFAERLQQLGLELPDAPKPVAAYVPAAMCPSGVPVFVSGQVPFRNGELMATGTVPNEVSMELARDCARQCVLNGLAALKAEIRSLDRVRRVVRVGVFVAAPADFAGHPKVADGASELLVDLFGDAGRHARAAVGVATLPLNVPVEIEFMFLVD